MGLVKKYEEGELTVLCAVCGREFSRAVPSDFSPKFREEHNQYDNLTIACANCDEEGKNVTVVVNINIPEGEFDEEDTEYAMPFSEINARKYIRDVMWEFRPDLLSEDRVEFNASRPRVAREAVEEAKQIYGGFETPLSEEEQR